MPSAINFWLPINKEDWASMVNDALSGSPVEAPCGCAMQFNFCFSQGTFEDANLLDLSNYTEIVFEILKPDLSAVLISQTIDSSKFLSCTVEEFNNFAAAQLQIFVPSASNLLTTSGGGYGNFLLQVYGVDADAASDIDILCCFQINAKPTGIGLNPALSTATTTRGATAIAAGAAAGTVALNLAYVPTTVILTVQAPDGNGEILTATLAGAPTGASFNFNLSAATDRAGYVLHWVALQ